MLFGPIKGTATEVEGPSRSPHIPEQVQAVWYFLYRSIYLYSVVPARRIRGSGRRGVRAAEGRGFGDTDTCRDTSMGSPSRCG